MSCLSPASPSCRYYALCFETGAALALEYTGRLASGIMGDDDFLMGITVLWTAANSRLPLLIIVANNRSYYNDVQHQERVAVTRGRSVENRWVGQRIDDPPVDLAANARSQGCEAAWPISTLADLPKALEFALARVKEGAIYALGVSVAPGGGE